MGTEVPLDKPNSSQASLQQEASVSPCKVTAKEHFSTPWKWMRRGIKSWSAALPCAELKVGSNDYLKKYAVKSTTQSTKLMK